MAKTKQQAMREAALEAMGWMFCQTGPNEGEWMKFVDDGKPVARQCDEAWEQDLASADRQQQTMLHTALEVMGWKFCDTGPGWEWLKFDSRGKRIASQGDKTWLHDYALAERVQREGRAAYGRANWNTDPKITGVVSDLPNANEIAEATSLAARIRRNGYVHVKGAPLYEWEKDEAALIVRALEFFVAHAKEPSMRLSPLVLAAAISMVETSKPPGRRGWHHNTYREPPDNRVITSWSFFAEPEAYQDRGVTCWREVERVMVVGSGTTWRVEVAQPPGRKTPLYTRVAELHGVGVNYAKEEAEVMARQLYPENTSGVPE